MKRARLVLRVVAVAALTLLPALGATSDHDDTAELKTLGRHDARLTDLYAFTRGDRLILALCTNPAIAPGTTDYAFPPDLTLRFFIDNNSEVRFDDAEDLTRYGGTIVDPGRLHQDFVFEVTFDRRGTGRLRAEGLPGHAEREIEFFYGLRDDPFIRGPRIGKNVAAVVLELPLVEVLGPQTTLLIWATSKAPEIHGPMSELAGRALRSQFAENLALNTLHPKEHFARLGLPPDVIILDSSRPSGFPNGRLLDDDVVNLVGDTRVLETDAPFPTQNDVPFLKVFPYLAPPQ